MTDITHKPEKEIKEHIKRQTYRIVSKHINYIIACPKKS